jgi:hypothetical protein
MADELAGGEQPGRACAHDQDGRGGRGLTYFIGIQSAVLLTIDATARRGMLSHADLSPT